MKHKYIWNKIEPFINRDKFLPLTIGCIFLLFFLIDENSKPPSDFKLIKGALEDYSFIKRKGYRGTSFYYYIKLIIEINFKLKQAILIVLINLHLKIQFYMVIQ